MAQSTWKNMLSGLVSLALSLTCLGEMNPLLYSNWDKSNLYWQGRRVGWVFDRERFTAPVEEQVLSGAGEAKGRFANSLKLPNKISQFQEAFDQMLTHFIETRFKPLLRTQGRLRRKDGSVVADSESTANAQTETPSKDGKSSKSNQDIDMHHVFSLLLDEMTSGKTNRGYISFQLQQGSENDPKSLRIPDGNNEMAHADNYNYGGSYYIVSDALPFMTSLYSRPDEKVGKLGQRWTIYVQDGSAWHSSKPYCPLYNEADSNRRSNRRVSKTTVRTFLRILFYHPDVVRHVLLPETIFKEHERQNNQNRLGYVVSRPKNTFTSEQVLSEISSAMQQYYGMDAKSGRSDAETADLLLSGDLDDIFSKEGEGSVAEGAQEVVDKNTRSIKKLSLKKASDRPVATQCPPVYGADLLMLGSWIDSAQECHKHTIKHENAAYTYTHPLDEFREKARTIFEKAFQQVKQGSDMLAIKDGSSGVEMIDKSGMSDARIPYPLLSRFFYTAADLPMSVNNAVKGSCYLRGGSTQTENIGNGHAGSDFLYLPHEAFVSGTLTYAEGFDVRDSGQLIGNLINNMQSNSFTSSRKENFDVISELDLQQAHGSLGEDEQRIFRKAFLQSSGGRAPSSIVEFFNLFLNGRKFVGGEEYAGKSVDENSGQPGSSFSVLKLYKSRLTDRYSAVDADDCEAKCHEYNKEHLMRLYHYFLSTGQQGEMDFPQFIINYYTQMRGSLQAFQQDFCLVYTYTELHYGGDFGSFYSPAVSRVQLEGRCVMKAYSILSHFTDTCSVDGEDDSVSPNGPSYDVLLSSEALSKTETGTIVVVDNVKHDGDGRKIDEHRDVSTIATGLLIASSGDGVGSESGSISITYNWIGNYVQYSSDISLLQGDSSCTRIEGPWTVSFTEPMKTLKTIRLDKPGFLEGDVQEQYFDFQVETSLSDDWESNEKKETTKTYSVSPGTWATLNIKLPEKTFQYLRIVPVQGFKVMHICHIAIVEV